MADKVGYIGAVDGTTQMPIPVTFHDNGDGTWSQGDYSGSASASAALYAGTLATSTIAAAIASSQAVSEVLVQNDPDNTVDLFIGNASAQPIQLKPGDSLSLSVTNLAIVFAKAASGTPTLNYLGRS